MQEVELKLYVPDLDAVRQRLESLGARLKAPRVYERNTRYENGAQSLSPAGIVLRLRQDTRTRLTYKDGGEMAGDSGIHSRFEAEVEVSDFDTMDTILRKLGYQPYWIYEKYRTTYVLDGVEVVLDEMPYGNFVELEGDEGAIQQVRARLGLEAARAYGAGYALLFERARRSLGLAFNDLTFANFEGVDVPESAFEDRT